MNTYIIIDAKSTILLEEKISKYDISILGSLTIQNMHYYQAFVGVLKEVPATISVSEVPEVNECIPSKVIPKDPKPKPKRKSKAKPKTTEEKKDV